MASSIASHQLPSLSCQTQSRPLYKFPPDIWGDRLASIPFDQDKLEWYDGEVEMLKGKVEAKLKDAYSDAAERIKLIDLICRLGISYHFQAEIERQLRHIFDSQPNLLDKKGYDLYTAAIIFRVFRQHGIRISSSDTFNKFKDSERGKFKDSLANDPKGLLSLFEAAHLSTPGEEILDEALDFTRTHLEQLLVHSKSNLADEITSSLLLPLHKAPPRLKVREFISFYEKRHQNYNEPRNDTILLKFAKLDFNRVQLLHQQEIRSIYKWSKEQDLASKLPFARDRIIEFFFWSETVCTDPRYAYARAEYTKQCNLLTFLDDIYDASGDFDELPIFTDAMERWDRNMIDQLPRDYMKHLYKIYLESFDELQSHAARVGTSVAVSLTRDYVTEFAKGYALEAHWMNNGYIPSFEESLELGIVIAGKRLLHAFSFIEIGELTLQAFQWLQNGPLMAEATSAIARLANELVSSKREEESGNVTKPWTCYKREYKTSDEETVAEFQRRISNAWKTINEELLRESSKVPLEILIRVVNFARIMEVVYKDRDLMTDTKYAESCIKTLYFDPIPL